jgi:hypothetical protein
MQESGGECLQIYADSGLILQTHLPACENSAAAHLRGGLVARELGWAGGRHWVMASFSQGIGEKVCERVHQSPRVLLSHMVTGVDGGSAKILRPCLPYRERIAIEPFHIAAA